MGNVDESQFPVYYLLLLSMYEHDIFTLTKLLAYTGSM